MDHTELKKAILEMIREDKHFAILLAEELSPVLNEMVRIDVTRCSYDDFGNGDGAISDIEIDFCNNANSEIKEYISQVIQSNFQEYFQTIFSKNRKMLSETRSLYFELFHTYAQHLNPSDIDFMGKLDLEFLKIKTNLEKIQKIGQGALKEQEKDYPDPYFIRILKLELKDLENNKEK